MRTFYGDDTYARSNKGDKSPRLHLFGGVFISKSSERKLLDIIREEKAKYTHPNLPIKWNFKDNSISDKFKRFDRLEEYKTMLVSSKVWRRNIIERSLQLDYNIVCGIIESYSSDQKKIKSSKDDLLKYSFENILMRIGYDVKNTDEENYVIIDWPPDGNPQPFIEGFYRLYHTGMSSANKPSISGKLSESNFFHSLLFAKCTHSPMLQFADLIVGSLKDFLESRLKEKENYFADEIFNLYKKKFRQVNNEILKYGILLSTGNKELNKKVEIIIKST